MCYFIFFRVQNSEYFKNKCGANKVLIKLLLDLLPMLSKNVSINTIENKKI